MSGWFSVHSRSVARTPSTASAPSSSSRPAQPPSTARNSVSIFSHSSASAGSVPAAWRMITIRSPARSLVRRDWRAAARTSATGSSPSSNSPVPGPFRHRDGLVVPAEADVPQPVQHAGLGAEREVHRLERDARPVGDGGHGDGGVAVPREQLRGRVEDLAPGLGGLLTPPRRVVPPPGFDSTWHSATLSMYSLLSLSSQITGGYHDRRHATGSEHQDDRTGPHRVVPRRLRPRGRRTGHRRRAPGPGHRHPPRPARAGCRGRIGQCRPGRGPPRRPGDRHRLRAAAAHDRGPAGGDRGPGAGNPGGRRPVAAVRRRRRSTWCCPRSA